MSHIPITVHINVHFSSPFFIQCLWNELEYILKIYIVAFLSLATLCKINEVKEIAVDADQSETDEQNRFRICSKCDETILR